MIDTETSKEENKIELTPIKIIQKDSETEELKKIKSIVKTGYFKNDLLQYLILNNNKFKLMSEEDINLFETNLYQYKKKSRIATLILMPIFAATLYQHNVKKPLTPVSFGLYATFYLLTSFIAGPYVASPFTYNERMHFDNIFAKYFDIIPNRYILDFYNKKI